MLQCEETNSVSAVQTRIEAVIRQVLTDQNKPCPAMTAQSPLMGRGLGLDSLDFAVLVVRLDEAFGFDPFLRGEVERFPSTVGELAALYGGSARPAEAAS